MNNMLSELREILPVPESPLNADPAALEAVQGALGSSFPQDWLEYSRIYGSGFVRISGVESWAIYSAFQPSYPDIVTEFHQVWSADRESQEEQALPPGLFPEPGGLLPFGSGDGGSNLTWVTKGTPDEWTVAVMYGYNERSMKFLDMGFTEFLCKLLKRQLQSELPHWPSEWNPATDISFKTWKGPQ